MPAAPYPAIGIRPLIDGCCRGVRESLEDKTAQLAKDVAEFIPLHLTYPDDSPVRCVVSETTIGGVAEASRCKEQFRTENVYVDLTVTTSWNYITEVPDLDPLIPHTIWGLNGTERPGVMTLAAAAAAYNILGILCFGTYDHGVQDIDDSGLIDDVVENILCYMRVVPRVDLTKGRSYLSIGTASMGIAGCRVPEQFFADYLGTRTEYIGIIKIDRRIAHGIYDHQEYEIAPTWARRHLIIGENRNPEANRFAQEEYDEQFDYCIKILLIGRDLTEGNPALAKLGFVGEVKGHDAIVADFQGWHQWTNYKPNDDIPETFLNTIFDWDGKRSEKVLVMGGDVGSTVATFFSSVLTRRPQLFSDVCAYWSPEAAEQAIGHKLERRAEDGLIDLRSSGTVTLNAIGEEKDAEGSPVTKYWWEITEADIEADLKTPTFHTATREYFPGGGSSMHFTTAGGTPITATRLNFAAGQGLVLQISKGRAVELPDGVYDQTANRADPTWSMTLFVPRLTGQGAFTSAYDWMASWGTNHTVTGYGYFDASLIILASILRIFVYMRNVERERTLRLRAWVPFGTTEPESVDFQARVTFGPLYR